MQNTVTPANLPIEYLRIRPAAAFIGDMSVAFLRKEARLGRGPERVRCGKILLYPIAGLRKYMESRTEQRPTSDQRTVCGPAEPMAGSV